MGIQTIIDNATYISFEHKKVTAQQISRSGRLTTAELASAVPFKFTVGMHEGLTYSNNRALLSEIDELDITVEETIDIGSTNTNLSYVTAYQGDSTGIGSVTTTATGYNGANIYLNCASAGSGTYLFKKGDFIQIGPTNGRYPYIVTADVAHSTSSNVTVPVHRPVIPQSGFTLGSRDIAVGSDVDFRVKLVSKPTYSVVPYDRIVFSSDFELIEVIRKNDG